MHMQVLKFYNLEGQSKWLNLLYETCFLFLFLVLAWWASRSPLRSTVVHPFHAHHLLHARLNISTCSFATDMEVAAGHCVLESATGFIIFAGLGWHSSATSAADDSRILPTADPLK